MYEWYMDKTGRELCPVAGFGIGSVEVSYSSVRVLISFFTFILLWSSRLRMCSLVGGYLCSFTILLLTYESQMSRT
jgi:hypothetical protein